MTKENSTLETTNVRIWDYDYERLVVLAGKLQIEGKSPSSVRKALTHVLNDYEERRGKIIRDDE